MSGPLADVVAFAAVAGLVTIVPGLDTTMVLRSTLVHGRTHGVATALGINTGALVWGAGAAVGVSALLSASTAAYTVVRLAGAAYMVSLGGRLLLTAVRGGEGPQANSVAAVAPSLLRSWSRGLMTNLLNPKIGAFYVAVLPQFIPPHAPHLAMGLLLALVHDIEGLTWFTVIITTAHSFRTLAARRGVHRGVDTATGLTLMGAGMHLGLASR